MFCDEYAVQSAVARETDKMTITFYINYSTFGGVLNCALCSTMEIGKMMTEMGLPPDILIIATEHRKICLHKINKEIQNKFA